MKRTLLCLATGAILSSCSNGGGKQAFLEDILSANLVPVTNYDSYGFINPDGELVIPASFAAVNYFHDGLACALDSSGEHVGYIDKKGLYAIKPAYASVSDFSDGLAWVALPDSSLTAIDKKGNVKLRCPQAYTINPFLDGYSVFYTFAGKPGVTDKKGNITMMPDSVSRIDSPSYGYLGALTDSGRHIIYAFNDGKLALTPVSSRFEISSYDNESRLAVVKQGDKYGLADYDGNLRINPRYDRLVSDGNRYIYLNEKEKYGWIDSDGKELIPAKYKAVDPFFNGMSASGFDAKYTIVSTSGSKYQVIDLEGKTVIGPKYDKIKSFDGRYFMVKTSVGWGLADASSGDIVCEPQFQNMEAASTKVLMATSGDNKWGVIDIHGKYLGQICYAEPDINSHIGMQARSNRIDIETVAAYIHEQAVRLNDEGNTTLGQLMNLFNIRESELSVSPFAPLFSLSSYNGSLDIAGCVNLNRDAKTISYSGYWSRRAKTTVNHDAKAENYIIFVTAPGKNRAIAETLEKNYGFKIQSEGYSEDAFETGETFNIEITPGQPVIITPPISDMCDDESAGLDDYAQ